MGLSFLYAAGPRQRSLSRAQGLSSTGTVKVKSKSKSHCDWRDQMFITLWQLRYLFFWGIGNTAYNSSSVVAWVSVAADTCLWSCCLEMSVSSGSNIPPFRCHVTIYILTKGAQFSKICYHISFQDHQLSGFNITHLTYSDALLQIAWNYQLCRCQYYSSLVRNLKWDTQGHACTHRQTDLTAYNLSGLYYCLKHHSQSKRILTSNSLINTPLKV
jgi:hypothetical protein